MKLKRNTFFCFSPPVMMATFLAEVTLAGYVLWRYRMSVLARLVTVMLVSLATFQLAEYFVCGGMGMDARAWSRIGYAAITLLPPLGLHITHVIAKRPMNRLTGLAYANSALWMGLFLFSQSAFTGYTCGGNYVIFQLKPPLGDLYFAFYYIWLLITMYQASRLAKKASARARNALTAQVLGYAAFMLPTSIISLLWPHTAKGLPSIMCGFAVIYAFVLTFKVMPLAKEKSAAFKQKT